LKITIRAEVITVAKGKILVVDDEPEIVRSVGMRLRAGGYEVVSAMDGLQATNVALREQPDLIILDIGMPAGDGHVVAKRLRQSIRTCSVPIIFLTARTAEEDFSRALDAGVAKYIVKPFDPSELMTVVESLMKPSIQPAP
jgi:DNA-binding response OmpR family regulator